MKELIEKLERAEDGSYELDREIAAATGGPLHDARPYTTSLDAALTLVPEGLKWLCGYSGRGTARPWAHIGMGLPEEGPDIHVEGKATVPLALCIAALKARAAIRTPQTADKEAP